MPPLSCAVPRSALVVVSKKRTEPAGTPLPEVGVTVAVKLTARPTVDGLGAAVSRVEVVARALTISVAVAVAVWVGSLNDCTRTVTLPCPDPTAFMFSRIAPVASPGSRKSGIDPVGRPSNPVRLDVTGPSDPVMAAA